jgi:hypothetical protein
MSVLERFPNIVEVFKKLAENRRYGPIDRLARALSPEMIRMALYEALRIATTESWGLPPDKEVDEFLTEAEKNPGLAQRIAIIALTSAPRSE